MVGLLERLGAVVSRSRAIKCLVISGVAWGGSIPWIIYLAAKGEAPWIVPIACIPVYLLLLYGLRPVWRIACRKDGDCDIVSGW